MSLPLKDKTTYVSVSEEEEAFSPSLTSLEPRSSDEVTSRFIHDYEKSALNNSYEHRVRRARFLRKLRALVILILSVVVVISLSSTGWWLRGQYDDFFHPRLNTTAFVQTACVTPSTTVASVAPSAMGQYSAAVSTPTPSVAVLASEVINKTDAPPSRPLASTEQPDRYRLPFNRHGEDVYSSSSVGNTGLPGYGKGPVKD